MVVLVARIRFVFVAKINHLRMKIIYNNARRKEVLILVNASLIAKTINRVNNPASIFSKLNAMSARVR